MWCDCVTCAGCDRAAASSDLHFTKAPAWSAASSLVPSAISAENM